MAGVVALESAERRPAGLWWTFALSVLLAVRVASNGAMPAIAHDSFQYLAVAEQAIDGRLGHTSLVHFDAERSFGKLPAPMVTFPAGYPLVVALLSVLGFTLARAALLLNVACALATVPLLWWMTGRAGLRSTVRHAVIALAALNGAFLLFATTAATETLFTTILLSGAALLLRAQTTRDGQSVRTWATAGVAFGAAYHVRYAGIFFVVGLGVVAAYHLLGRRRVQVIGYVVTGIVASTIVMAGMLRNIMLVGNWRGGNEKEVSNAIGAVVKQTVRAVNGLALGPLSGSSDDTLIPRALFGAAVIALVALLIWQRARGSTTVTIPPQTRSFAVDLLLLVAVYAAFMFYAGMSTVISYGTRMFVPLVPVLALLAGIGICVLLPPPGQSSRRLGVVLIAMLTAYAGFNLASLRIPGVDRASPVVDQLNSVTESGGILRDLIAGLAPEGRVIVANNGQALGYLLQRPTVSLVGPHYSQIVWTDRAVRAVVDQYEAAVVIITAPNALQPADSDLIPAPFVDALARGESPPWLRLVTRAGPVFVYVPVRASS